MKKIKILFILLLVAVMCTMVFAACGGGDNSDDTTPQTYTLFLSSTGQGATSGGGSFEAGATITVTATPNSEYIFDGWYDDETKVSDSISYTFTMPNNAVSLTANFSLPESMKYSLTLEQTGLGSILGGGNFLSGATATVHAYSTSIGFSFDGWYEDETLISSETDYTFAMPDRDITLNAVFNPSIRLQSKLYSTGLVSFYGSDSAYSSTSQYRKVGTDVTIVATPTAGYAFDGWYDGETKVSSSAVYTFVMPNNPLTLTAKFWQVPTLSQILAELSNNRGSFVATGEMEILGTEPTFNRVVELQYEVNNYYSFLSEKTHDVHIGENAIGFNEWYYDYNFTYVRVYHRERDIGTVWTVSSPVRHEENLSNTFLFDMPFGLLDATMFTESNNYDYLLNNALILSPMWYGWIDNLISMTITVKENGADLSFTASGTIDGNEVTVTATFNIILGSSLSRPSWAVA